jgi:hypothetical protein
MAGFAKGKRALAISDRSGQQFPYREMVKEWNNSFVHILNMKKTSTIRTKATRS